MYCVPCRDCVSVYVGDTKRNMKTRIREQTYAVKENNKIVVHVQEEDYRIDWVLEEKNGGGS